MKKVVLMIIGLIAIFMTFVGWGIVSDLFGDNLPSAKYHVLNAAIKNTCFIDPEKNHCPKTVEDLINVEPENFRELTKNANLTYRYYPDTNQYTLIVRNKNMWRDNYRVVIFDPRLVTAKNYGTGLDFVDASVSENKGKIMLDSPPPFEGPWDEIN